MPHWWWVAGSLALAVALAPACSSKPGPAPERARPASDESAALFDHRHLHEIRLRMNPKDWAALLGHYGDDTYYEGELVWRDRQVSRVGLRSRGSGSRNEHKPGLKIDFHRYIEDQRFLGLTALVLDNLYTDVSLLREHLAMAFLARIGLAVPREAYAKLFVNDEYIGLYCSVEPIDRHFLSRVNGPGDTGYLFEYRWKDEWHFTDLGPSLEPYRERFSARTHERQSDDLLYRPVRDFVRASNGSSSGRRDLEPYLDVRLFLRQLAGEAFLADWDGLVGDFGMNNFYLHRAADSGQFRFLPWDKDGTFKADDYPLWPDGMEENRLVRRLMADPDLKSLYLRELARCADVAESREGGNGSGGPWFERLLEERYAQIADAAHTDGRKPQSNRLFDEAVDGLRRFVRVRPGVVRAFVEKGEKGVGS
jgi:hypothetical protein